MRPLLPNRRSFVSAAIVAICLLALVGCQGFSSKQQDQSPGAITPSPGSFSFGNVTVGTTQTLSGSLANTGQSSITITQISVTGTGYSVSGITAPVTLAAGQSVNFSVAFAPTSEGAVSGNIALGTANGPTNIALSGTGVGTGDLSTSPTDMIFTNILVGDASSQTETLKNTGSANVDITASAISGAGFSYSGLSVPLTLSPNQSVSFSISFAPSVSGSVTGAVELIVSGAPTVYIGLSGSAITPATLAANPTSVSFTNITAGQTSSQTETIQNTGGSSAEITQIAASGKDFTVSGFTLPITLTPGQSASFSVNFAPASAGNYSGSVSVASNASDSNLSIALAGTAVTGQGTLSVSSPIAVGNVAVGSSGTASGSLTATAAAVQVSSVSLSGANTAEFSISGLTFPVTVNPGTPVSFTVKFTPTATGSASATASFANNGTVSSVESSLTGTGTTAPAHTVVLNWSPSETQGITSYNVYRAVYSGSCGTYSNIGSTSASTTTYTDSSVTDGTTYCYATTAVDPEGESAYSNIAEAVIPAP
jgi:hypothetical protein